MTSVCVIKERKVEGTPAHGKVGARSCDLGQCHNVSVTMSKVKLADNLSLLVNLKRAFCSSSGSRPGLSPWPHLASYKHGYEVSEVLFLCNMEMKQGKNGIKI